MLKPSLPRSHRVQGNDIGLNVLEFGPAEAPAVVMVHGLRDSAYALQPVAEHLAVAGRRGLGYRVLVCELRGHGASDRSAAYSMPNFLLDLHAVVTELTESECCLFGHSLGGHIVTKFASLFPEMVKAMLVVEGLGPPKRPHEGDPQLEVRAYRDMLMMRLGSTAGNGKKLPKPITGTADVAARLCRNNPRLAPSEAQRLAPHLIHKVGDAWQWAFDSRASSVFIGSSSAENERFAEQVHAPTCVISGALSYEYWGREMASPEFSGHFAEGEIETRAAHFPQHEHHWFENSGHMVHYDEPERLSNLSQHFLEQHYV